MEEMCRRVAAGSGDRVPVNLSAVLGDRLWHHRQRQGKRALGHVIYPDALIQREAIVASATGTYASLLLMDGGEVYR